MKKLLIVLCTLNGIVYSFNNNTSKHELTLYTSKYGDELETIKQLFRKDNDRCLNGGLVDSFGEIIQPIQCQYSSSAYTLETTIPQYDKIHHTNLEQVYNRTLRPVPNELGTATQKCKSCILNDYHN